MRDQTGKQGKQTRKKKKGEKIEKYENTQRTSDRNGGNLLFDTSPISGPTRMTRRNSGIPRGTAGVRRGGNRMKPEVERELSLKISNLKLRGFFNYGAIKNSKESLRRQASGLHFGRNRESIPARCRVSQHRWRREISKRNAQCACHDVPSRRNESRSCREV